MSASRKTTARCRAAARLREGRSAATAHCGDEEPVRPCASRRKPYRPIRPLALADQLRARIRQLARPNRRFGCIIDDEIVPIEQEACDLVLILLHQEGASDV